MYGLDLFRYDDLTVQLLSGLAKIYQNLLVLIWIHCNHSFQTAMIQWLKSSLIPWLEKGPSKYSSLDKMALHARAQIWWSGLAPTPHFTLPMIGVDPISKYVLNLIYRQVCIGIRPKFIGTHCFRYDSDMDRWFSRHRSNGLDFIGGKIINTCIKLIETFSFRYNHILVVDLIFV